MGEIAEAMLNGTLCEECGDFIDAGSGYPRLRELRRLFGYTINRRRRGAPKDGCWEYRLEGKQ